MPEVDELTCRVARRWCRVRRKSFLCFFLRIRLRRFLISEPMAPDSVGALVPDLKTAGPELETGVVDGVPAERWNGCREEPGTIGPE